MGRFTSKRQLCLAKAAGLSGASVKHFLHQALSGPDRIFLTRTGIYSLKVKYVPKTIRDSTV
jgi:hypothetical protein